MAGQHCGHINNVFTYYGEIEYSYNENINLLDINGNVIENISNIYSDDDTLVLSHDDWVVTLVETVSWKEDDKEPKREVALLIFCPFYYENAE